MQWTVETPDGASKKQRQPVDVRLVVRPHRPLPLSDLLLVRLERCLEGGQVPGLCALPVPAAALKAAQLWLDWPRSGGRPRVRVTTEVGMGDRCGGAESKVRSGRSAWKRGRRGRRASNSGG